MTDSPLTVLTSAGAVLDALGGSTAAARLVGSTVAHASNWRASGYLPPRTFLIFRAALAELGATAPAALWRIDEAATGDLNGAI